MVDPFSHVQIPAEKLDTTYAIGCNWYLSKPSPARVMSFYVEIPLLADVALSRAQCSHVTMV